MADSEETTGEEIANTPETETESTTDISESVPVEESEEPQEGINLGTEEDDVAIAPSEEEAVVEEKPPVKQKVSIDETDQITTSKVDEDNVNLDSLVENIDNPEAINHPENIFGSPRGQLGPVIEFSSSESSLEEEEELTSDIISYLAELGLQGKEPIDRSAYEEEYKKLKAAAVNIRRKNGLLHRKIGEYYKKRKILRVFQDVPIDMYESLLDKYEQKAMDLHDFIQRVNREKEAINNELKDMRTLRDEQKEELNQNFTSMQEREHEIGHGLIDSHTGKAISDKVIDRFLHRQKAKSDEIAVIRLHYIKRRDRVKEIEHKIKSLETIDGTLHLMDFEQLRMENQTFSDKIEERDEELMRLRGRYSHAMQALAHIREKINIIQVQIEELHDKKICEETSVNRTRELLNGLKIQRDMNRAHRAKLKSNTGILTYPKLLLDMEIEMNKIEKLREQLENLKLRNKEDRLKLLNIRVMIEKTGHVREKKYIKKLRTTKGDRRYLFSRPTLSYPLQNQIALLKARISDLDLDDI